MKRWIRLILLTCFSACMAHQAASQTGIMVNSDAIVVCPAIDPTEQPPTFDEPDCQTVRLDRVDPQDRLIWIKAKLTLPDSLLAASAPLGLYVYAKASSTIYLNGERVGQNGAPAAIAENETPGLMDFVTEAPRDVLKAGDNELIVLMSSHHGYLNLISPVHILAVAPYAIPTQSRLSYYWPSLIPFGVLLAGALYFSTISFMRQRSGQPLLLALISLFAAGQLLFEVSRGLIAYDYPVHDLRLILILLTSLGFGLTLAALMILSFPTRHRFSLLAAIVAATSLTVLFVNSYDQKSAFALFVPMVAAAAYTSWAALQARPNALSYAIALTACAVLMLLRPLSFLDTYFFYIVAALALFLFVQQAVASSRERQLRAEAQEQSRKLELVLEQLRENAAPDHLTISGSGSIERVVIDHIAFCSGAGDYVELALEDGGHVLHNGSLNELEERLPATFIRVHRSYIVNTTFVKRLERDSSGGGRLILLNGAEVPVSRRIMPRVRDVLS